MKLTFLTVISAKKRLTGFTLVEVLIALVIIFGVLTTTTFVYTTAQRNSAHVEDTVRMIKPLSLILDTVKHQIRQNPVSDITGDGELFGVVYRWKATAIKFRAPPEQFVVESNEVLKYKPRFILYQVDLSVELNGKQRSYQYEEIAWKSTAEIL